MNKKTLNTLLVGAVAATALGASAAQAGPAEGNEKCYGVVKAGMNGCGAADGSHGCAGMATEDASGVEWVSVPKGLCEKLAHGSTTPVTAEDHGEEH
ncbi:MAG: DUF2282 domain-containing protein [Alphaproteobacteria bacterium]|nr:DUF2282 domain-containing protein [Alphaproteobacteria bacterium]